MIIIITCIILTYSYIKYHNNKNLKQASYIYYNLITAMHNDDTESVHTNAISLLHNHKKTIYYELSCLFLSKIAIMKKNNIDAKYYLTLIIKNKNTSLYDTANIRLINILFKEKKYIDIINNINNNTNKNYTYLYENIKGDIYVALNNITDAKKSYYQSLLNADNKNYKRYMKQKIKNLTRKL